MQGLPGSCDGGGGCQDHVISIASLTENILTLRSAVTSGGQWEYKTDKGKRGEHSPDRSRSTSSSKKEHGEFWS